LRTYEAVIILDDRKVEGKGNAFVDQVAQDIRDLGGKIRERRCLGRRHFAYKIKRRSAGTYWDLILDLDPSRVRDLQDRYKLREEVLRMVVFLYEEPPRKQRGVAKQSSVGVSPDTHHDEEDEKDE